MDSTRHTQGPSGIKKAIKQGRRPGKTACTACHARKKRCDIAPPYHQCTHCRKEDQLCIPRDSTERTGRPARQQMLNRSQNASKNTSKNESQFHVNGFLPMGIDHEVPRWSAVYSSYSEIRRLLPSLTSTSSSPSSEMEDIAQMQTAPIERIQHVSLSELDCSRNFQSETLTRNCVEAAPIKGISIPVSRSRSLSPVPLDERVGLEKALACEAEILYGGLAPEEVIFPSGGDSRSAHDVFMNDLDALLRF
ncbi:hypothetical protein N7491_005149 [Penicillium cf. griseofulvum]|uniref:Zn(2)-C6 fungal-type domain-containing protein n=1 Tax=Penicillium cf. griseofulvum TaxID=2972120 RepID=A0A9W9M4P4_9EURO|nr:hypothetical protein N7472_007842 [Penicillium cf. griseofulvum]KAJ5434554.1 hypothetical protein N7491_005149 [Penicillium cf. griseofulvum]KAJ5452383.1 hypothetical protein N7445_000566 [Penicillium cf. griseofulvum]